jgi:hypothetical protein
MMPLQELFPWTIRLIRRKHGEHPAVESIIIAAVLKFFTDTTAHFDSVIECDSKMAKVKEVM